MKRTLVFTMLGALLFAGVANAELQTRTMDPVKGAVEERDTALGDDVDKSQKKLKKTYTKVLKSFAKESTSQKMDAKLIKKISGTLAKGAAEDAELLGILDGDLESWLTELEGSQGEVNRKLGYCSDDNKKKAKAQKAYDKTTPVLTDARAAEDAKTKGKMAAKFQKSVAKADKSAKKALVKEELTAHQEAFLVILDGYQGADSCAVCHEDTQGHLAATGHWNWEGVSANIEGYETGTHGKTDLINNFCIAIPTNEGRCTQCHIGYGWDDKNFDRTDLSQADCLVCHDTTGTYAKAKKTAGNPEPAVDLVNVALNVGSPNRKNCGACHFKAGGGDNVKHGDLASTLVATTRDKDVHMATDGGDLSCQECHKTNDQHGIAGMPLHSVDEGSWDCTDCHTESTADHAGITAPAEHLGAIACQTCHIPAFARDLPTKVEWYWEDAGDDVDPIPTDQYGKPLYDKMKGTFVWAKDVEPEVMWFNGKWKRMIIGENDQYTELPVVLAEPVGSLGDGKLYPFKKMVGSQPAGTDKTMLVPHLFGMKGGPNPYWVKYDWDLALQDGAAYTGQPYTPGAFEFVDTVMYLSVNHEIAPKENARSCLSCHDVNGGLDWKGLGYTENPNEMGGGG